MALIPKDCTFVDPDTMMTTAGKTTLLDMLKKAEKRDPDAHGLYVYNDFLSYALLDLVDKTLASINTKVVKKSYDDAFVLLEALTAFNDRASEWQMCDDGDRVDQTNKAYGALLIATLRGLNSANRLDAAHFPTLETLLRGAAEWGAATDCPSPYDVVCKAIGRRLFGDKTAAERELEKARVEEWVASCGAEMQRDLREGMKEKAEEEGEDGGKLWYDGVAASDEDKKHTDFTVSRVYKAYKDYLKSCPSGPLKGPSWDISTWSAEDKAQFSFDNEDGGF